ncbi:SLC13 family permease [Thiomicrorhabdus sp. zzn3]|jgi:di/tricarboxylate transporter|uniref:SLC13 family permease n=1 Tax=Thiomicrorhabdus sp. zzn3 TaxID=3039775 RepID=UPI00243685EE|nr:SLC13 family permease [Thiomicrorhabdus sp. zzn3]MDG6777358.1 SLC13 family permease [Thiomicrorhabdus sp. zzn3]
MLVYGVLASIIALLALLVWGRVQPFKLFAALLLIYYTFDLIPLQVMLGNFVNPALITLVFLLLVSSVLEKTNLFQALARWLVASSERGTMTRMGSIVGFGSAFLNNTAVVASLMSLIGKTKRFPSSKLLIPLSYIAIFGGTLTLVGTSTHLIINSFAVQAGLPELGIFDFLYVGFFILLFGTLTLIVLAPKLLPSIQTETEQRSEYLIETKLAADSELVGLSIEQAGLRQLEDLYLAQVVSGKNKIGPVSPQYVLQAGDHLLFAGDIKAAPKLLLFSGLSFLDEAQGTKHNQLVEVVVSHQSPMIGSTIKKANFRNKFDAAVVAIRRGGQELEGRLAQVILQAGDALVLVTGPDFEKRENLDKNFYFYTPLETQQHLNVKQSTWAVLGFVSVIGLAAFGVIPLIKGLMLLLVAYLLFGLTSIRELRRKVPFEIAMIVGAALGIAKVMTDSGAADMIADSVLSTFGYWGVFGSFIGVYLLTVLLTELVTNNAAAALGFPIALVTAEALGVSPWPFVMAVAYGASASFLTPYGYQTNLMVYSPGGYRFLDYVKMGMPVSLVYGLTVLSLVPVFFPF